VDPGEVPEVLKGLTFIETMLISPAITVIYTYIVKGGQSRFKRRQNDPPTILVFNFWIAQVMSSLRR
jgi:hypothetical protein